MKEFASLLLGNVSLPMFFGLFFFAMIGVFINLLIHATTRDQNSPATPVKFSFRFLLWDNWKRIVLSILLIYVSIRFVSMFFAITVDGKNEYYLFAALLIGFGFDKLGELIKKKSSWLKVREEEEKTPAV
jgi:hypothetical protein